MTSEVLITPLRIGDWLREATDQLAAAGFEVPRLEANRLAEAGLSATPAGLVLRAGEALAAAERARLDQLLAERLAGRPLQYVLRRAAFRNLELEVGPGVFIPRPETEGLVQRGLDWLRAHRPAPARPRVVDYGLGSGAILAAILGEWPAAEGWGVELSPVALDCAQRNLDAAGVAGRARLLLGDLDAPLAACGAPPVDLIISNPPYIPTELMPTIPAAVREAEPGLALDGGPGGTTVIARILNLARGRLVPGGCVLLEIDDSHAPGVLALMDAAGLVDAEVLADDTGRPRYARGGAPR